jgi:prepilin-type N-terminal cleavage/methylation domain-containing protein
MVDANPRDLIESDQSLKMVPKHRFLELHPELTDIHPMKPTIPARMLRREAFTLIELLVVITIIAILAGLVISQAPRIMRESRELEVRNVITGLKTGIANYQVEYNRFPIPADSASGDEDAQAILTDDSNTLVDTLMGDSAQSSDSEPNPLNPKGIQFCDFRIAKNGVNGLANSQSPYRLVDLWGSPYYVLFDTNQDRKITNPDISNQDPKISQSAISPPPDNLPTDVAIYSIGQDKTQQTGDDIVSWRQ